MKVTYLDNLQTVKEAWDVQATFYGLDPEAGSPQRYAFYAGAAAIMMLLGNVSDSGDDVEDRYTDLLDEIEEFGVSSTMVPE